MAPDSSIEIGQRTGDAAAPAQGPSKCGTCDRPLDSALICSNCRTLLGGGELSHFELLGLTPAFDLDVEELRRRYFALLGSVHPDRFAGESPAAADVQRVAARLNAAYVTLSEPLTRAEYLLELHGGPSAAQDKTVAADVLAESLELNEQVAEARAADDTAALAACRTRVRNEHQRRCAALADLARQLPGDAAFRAKLRAELNAAKYYQRLREALETPA